MIRLNFYKRIATIRSSIFYSLIHYGNSILGFARKHYDSGRHIKMLEFDQDFNIVLENNQEFLRGEDPRCFIHNNQLYIVDNYCDDVHLINYETRKTTKIALSGKNFSFISHNNILYVIHTMIPFVMYSFDPDNGTLIKIPTTIAYNKNKEYRGGTPGYKKDKNIYFGFGHRTYNGSGGLTHDIYYWEVDFGYAYDPPLLTITNIDKPLSCKTITDPTSLIEINNESYLITAESDFPWKREQDYITNVYKVTYDPQPSPESIIDYIKPYWVQLFGPICSKILSYVALTLYVIMLTILYVIIGIVSVETVIFWTNKFIETYYSPWK